MKIIIAIPSSGQSLSRVWLFVTPWTAAHQAFLSITNSWSLLKLMSIELAMPSNHLILCHLLLLLPSIFPSIRVFSNESVLRIRWPKYWSFSFSINCSNEYSGLVSFRIDWLDLLAVQGSLKSLLQHHSSKINSLLLSFLYGPALTSIESMMPSSYLILCCPLLLLPPVPPSIRVFSNESALHMRWPKSWSFSFSITPSKEIPGLISFRMDRLDLLAVQGTLKSLLQHCSSNHQFFGAQLSSQFNSHIHTWPLEKP